jgi:tuberculosinol/isotuberculosinol synthase
LTIDRQSFEDLSAPEAASLVQTFAPLVVVFPINGTRRWFSIQQAVNPERFAGTSYYQAMELQHIQIYRLFFEHGVHTLLTPIFGADLMERGEDYIRRTTEGMVRLVTEPHFLDFYTAFQVRVRFYGDYRKHFTGTPYAHLIDLFDGITQRTRDNNRHRLFFGLFANDATETIAEFGVRYYMQHQQLPDRRTLVSLYYGEYLEPVSFFLGFDKLSAFDMPLLATGNEDLYFTASPSLDLTARQLRQILHDHLYTRRSPEADYESLAPAEKTWMQAFYNANHEHTLGLGALNAGVWYPMPAITWPPNPPSQESISHE